MNRQEAMKCFKRVSILFLLWRVSLGFVSVLPMETRRSVVDAPPSTTTIKSSSPPASKRSKIGHGGGSSSHSNSQSRSRKGPTSTSIGTSLTTELYASRPFNDTEDAGRIGRLEELKQREQELAAQLAAVRREKLSAIRSRPLTIGVVGFGRFGQFIARTFAKYGQVVVTSRSDYTEIANGMGVKYVPLDDPDKFLAQGLDVIVFAVSILSFKSTIKSFAPHIEKYVHARATNGDETTKVRGPLVVDVLSVKEHPRNVLLHHLPDECDILCTHPMFGPDSGKNGWQNLNFVYEKTRIDQVILDPMHQEDVTTESFMDTTGHYHSVHEDSDAHIEGVDRMERFLSIWEEEGCRMVPMSCSEHDSFAANSQFITHLMGRILGNQGLAPTPIDTMGFQSVLKLIDSTTADSFELFYGLYKYNQNSMNTIIHLQSAMSEVVERLKEKEKEEQLLLAEQEEPTQNTIVN